MQIASGSITHSTNQWHCTSDTPKCKAGILWPYPFGLFTGSRKMVTWGDCGVDLPDHCGPAIPQLSSPAELDWADADAIPRASESPAQTHRNIAASSWAVCVSWTAQQASISGVLHCTAQA